MKDSTTLGDILAATRALHALLDARLPAAAVAEQPTTPGLPPGWVRHDGGPNPRPGRKVAGVMFRGQPPDMRTFDSECWRWDHRAHYSDIIAYLPVSEPQPDPYVEAVQALAEVLDCFDEHGHPGRPCLRTGWVYVEQVEKWRAVLARVRP